MSNDVTGPVRLKSKAVIAAAAAYAEAHAVIEHNKPILLAAMGDERVAIAGNRIVKVSHVAGSPAIDAYAITQDMVGTIVKAKPARSPQRRLSVE